MKICFKCHSKLPLSQFYKHPKMTDGHLGKCKMCARKDTSERVALLNATDLDWILAERERSRTKAARQRANGKVQKNRYISIKRYRLRNPLKWAAICIANNAIQSGRLHRQGCEICGERAHKHHDDYAKPLEVRWLCPKHHGEHHTAIRTNQIINHFKNGNRQLILDEEGK